MTIRVFAVLALFSLSAMAGQPSPQDQKARALAPSVQSLQLKLVAEGNQTCNKEGTSVKGGTKWCRGGEIHECNGKTGEWTNLRQKCKS